MSPEQGPGLGQGGNGLETLRDKGSLLDLMVVALVQVKHGEKAGQIMADELAKQYAPAQEGTHE